MKRFVILATLVFWGAVAATQLMAARSAVGEPPAASPAVGTVSGSVSGTVTGTVSGSVARSAADARHSLAEVARHASPSDCWMVIDGVVYDFTSYLPKHPADPALIRKYCGRDASEAFRTKEVGRPHSPYAQQLLPAYRKGVLAR